MAGFDPSQLRDDRGQWARQGGGRAKATTFSELGRRQMKHIKAIPRKTAYNAFSTADAAVQAYRVYRVGRRYGAPHLDTGINIVDNALIKPFRR